MQAKLTLSAQLIKKAGVKYDIILRGGEITDAEHGKTLLFGRD